MHMTATTRDDDDDEEGEEEEEDFCNVWRYSTGISRILQDFQPAIWVSSIATDRDCVFCISQLNSWIQKFVDTYTAYPGIQVA